MHYCSLPRRVDVVSENGSPCEAWVGEVDLSCSGQSMVSSIWHDCQFMGRMGRAARESFVTMGYIFGSAAMANAAITYICTGVHGDDRMFYVAIIPRVSFVVMGNFGLFCPDMGPRNCESQAFSSCCGAQCTMLPATSLRGIA